jgi:hypothetical protein
MLLCAIWLFRGLAKAVRPHKNRQLVIDALMMAIEHTIDRSPG